VYERVNQTKKLILSLGLQNVVKVFADGGIRENTVPEMRASGVDGVVAGSLAFNQ
jgi:ribulose-phosphate 3-epimerase